MSLGGRCFSPVVVQKGITAFRANINEIPRTLAPKMYFSMLAAVNDNQISDGVVSRIPVDVVNMLVATKRTSKMFFHNQAMNFPKLSIYDLVPISRVSGWLAWTPAFRVPGNTVTVQRFQNCGHMTIKLCGYLPCRVLGVLRGQPFRILQLFRGARLTGRARGNTMPMKCVSDSSGSAFQLQCNFSRRGGCVGFSEPSGIVQFGNPFWHTKIAYSISFKGVNKC